MNANDHDLKDLIDRHLKWPSDLSFTAARGRVREQLFATPAYRQTARIADAPSSIPMWRMAAAAALVPYLFSQINSPVFASSACMVLPALFTYTTP